MDILGFWRIVDACRRAEEPEAALAKRLRRLSADEIASFDEHFCDRVDDACTWDLWGAAYLTEGGCSDDGFLYFRYGLVAAGRTVFDLALQNPDSLAKAAVSENEAYGSIALDVYRELTGRELARAASTSKPRGKAWDFDDDEECRRRLPRLHHRLALESFDELHLEGWEATQSGERAEGNAIYARALALLPAGDRHPGIPLVHGNMLSNATALGRVAEAQQHFLAGRSGRALVRELPQRAILDGQLAWFAFEHGTDEDCEEALGWLRESAPHAAEALALLDTEARILLRLGREGAARQTTKRALARDPSFGPLQDLKVRWSL